MPDGFHTSFQAALAGVTAALAPWIDAVEAAPGLSVHCNSIAKGCADAVVGQFPTVARVVGEPWLAAAGAAFAREHPPTRASLIDYGEAFPGWIAVFPPALDMPYLAGLARLDWLATASDVAADSPALDAAALALLSAADFDRYAVDLHPAARSAWFEDSTPDLWLALQAGGASHRELGDAPQGLVFVRPGVVRDHRLLSRGGATFLTDLAAGQSLAAAAAAALAVEPTLDLAAAFADLVVAGAFSSLRPLP